MRIGIVLAGALLAAGCTATTASYPVEVTRYHVDQVAPGTVAVVPDEGALEGSDFADYAGAVGNALTQRGYTVVAADAKPTYLARVAVRSDVRPFREPSSFSIGIGGGTYSGGRHGGVGVGGDVGIPIGKGKLREAVATTLSVKIDTRAGNQGVWEGRAQGQAVRTPGRPDAVPLYAKMATALFTSFPGESGRSITVK
jgi:hypothetical protein